MYQGTHTANASTAYNGDERHGIVSPIVIPFIIITSAVPSIYPLSSSSSSYNVPCLTLSAYRITLHIIHADQVQDVNINVNVIKIVKELIILKR